MKKDLKKITLGLGSAGLLALTLFMSKPVEVNAAVERNVESLTDLAVSSECMGPLTMWECEGRNTNKCSDLSGCNSNPDPTEN